MNHERPWWLRTLIAAEREARAAAKAQPEPVGVAS